MATWYGSTKISDTGDLAKDIAAVESLTSAQRTALTLGDVVASGRYTREEALGEVPLKVPSMQAGDPVVGDKTPFWDKIKAMVAGGGQPAGTPLQTVPTTGIKEFMGEHPLLTAGVGVLAGTALTASTIALLKGKPAKKRRKTAKRVKYLKRKTTKGRKPKARKSTRKPRHGTKKWMAYIRGKRGKGKRGKGRKRKR